ncbi:helicase [Tanacetum coccineum]
MARDWCHSHSSVSVELRLLSEKTSSRQYNAPTVAEVAALITNDFVDGDPIRDIIVNMKDEDGYHDKIPYHRNTGTRKTNRGYVTMKEYYAYVIQYRQNHGTTLHRGGRLFQQYLVDAYTAIEEQRLSWTRNNQDTLRVDVYHNVCDAITRGDTNAHGLPYAHILLWLEDHCKCRTPREIDDIISAELPSPTDDLTGYKAVTDYMLYDPCGKDARYAQCNVEGKCSKHFPTPIYEETIIDQDGYPIYRQRDNKVTFKKGTFKFDNRYVVPHNRSLLLKYQAHISVEWCKRSKAIKYLFKYLNKGPDKAMIVIQENVPNGQAVTMEKVAIVRKAVWCLLSFDIHYSYPSMMKLNFHLPNQQPVTLRDSESLPALLERKEETWEVLSEDILHLKCKLFKYPELQLTAEQIQNYCLVEIQEVLNRNGRSLAEF